MTQREIEMLLLGVGAIFRYVYRDEDYGIITLKNGIQVLPAGKEIPHNPAGIKDVS